MAGGCRNTFRRQTFASFRCRWIVARIVGAFRIVVAQLLRGLLDFVECVAVERVEQNVLEK
jgi:hypothetical protein